MEARLQRWVQRQGWDRASAHYEHFWQQQLQPAIDMVLAAAALQPGEHVIDVACGTGMVALTAAQRVAPGGCVLATDIAPKMTIELMQRAGGRGIDNVAVECRDAEDLGEQPAFDAALCSLGLMYVPDPLRAARELHRVLRPGGRAVVSVWGDRRHCGWAELFPIVAARVSSDVCPMFFALGTADVAAATLRMAGFAEVTTTRLSVELVYDDAEAALGAAFLGGPVALAYSRFDEATRRSAHHEYLTSLAPFANGSGYRVPGEFVIASARKSFTTIN
jgi:SAM-dependent methyltransferase